MSYGLPTLEQFRRIITMLKWWESQPRNKVDLGDWTPLVKRTADSTNVTVNVVTSVTVVGTNGTVNSQNLTVPAANATSSSNFTLPSGGTSNVPAWSGLMYAKSNLSADEDLVVGTGFFATQANWSGVLVANGSGGTWTPGTQAGSTYVIQVAGIGEADTSSGESTSANAFAVQLYMGGALVATGFARAVPDANDGGFSWALNAEITMGDPGTNSATALVNSVFSLGGPSLTLTAAGGAQVFSEVDPQPVDFGGGTLPLAGFANTLQVKVTTGASGTLTVQALTIKWYPPPLLTD